MTSPQTLSEDDRRLLAAWAAACAERVVHLLDGPVDDVAAIADALARTRAFHEGRSTAAAEIKRRMEAVRAASAMVSPAAGAAARSVAQASGVAHMGAHALGAAAYAVKAVSLVEGSEAAACELAWQVEQLTDDQRWALAQLPPAGTSPGPIGPGLLSRGLLGEVVASLQEAVRGS